MACQNSRWYYYVLRKLHISFPSCMLFRYPSSAGIQLNYFSILYETATVIVPSSQGVKKVLYKKKFHSSCCWASTFYSTSDVGLLLVFSNGKIEIRCSFLFSVPSVIVSSHFESGLWSVQLILTYIPNDYRSLPELSLLKETSVRGFSYSPPKVNSLPESTICSSKDGELLVVWSMDVNI